MERFFQVKEHGSTVKTEIMAGITTFIGGVQAHHHADGDDHFEVTVLVVGILTADLGKQVGPAPAEQGNEGKPEPHVFFFLLYYVCVIFVFWTIFVS